MTVGCRSPAWHQRYKMATRGCLLLSQNLKFVPCGPPGAGDRSGKDFRLSSGAWDRPVPR